MLLEDEDMVETEQEDDFEEELENDVDEEIDDEELVPSDVVDITDEVDKDDL